MNEHPHSAGPGQQPEATANWRHALADLLTARATIARLEAEDAFQAVQRKVIFAATAGMLACFAWGLLLLGAIPLITQGLANAGLKVGWPLVAIAVGLLHFLVAFVLLRKLRKTGTTPFAITRAEFIKDREWFKNLTPPES